MSRELSFTLTLSALLWCSCSLADLHSPRLSVMQQLIRFVNWPQGQPQGVVEVCIVGQEVLQQFRRVYSLQSNQGILRLSLWSSQNEQNCHMVYVSHKDSIAYQRQRPPLCQGVLVITDQLESLQQSASLALLGAQSPLKLAVNLDQADHCHLRLHSNLLELASPMQHEEH